MPEPEHTLSVSFKVRSYEVDQQQEATLPAVCNYFQEAAGLHAKELHFDISDLQKKGLTWVLYKLHIKVYQFPIRWEQVEVKTWPSIGEGLRAFRDYELRNSEGKILAAGVSQWMVLDIKKMRPVKIPNELMSRRFKTDRHVLDLHKNSLSKVSNGKPNLIATAGLNDLDMNHHVNNVRYIDWITGHKIPHSNRGMKCKEIVIQYVSETKARDQIYLSKEVDPLDKNTIHCTLSKNASENVIANAITAWG